jgi:tRNA-2-methylthio-N6-dimethylallyladenosine synthase
MPAYTVITFGCQMNVHDSQRIEEVLQGAGYTQTDSPGSADVVVLNTCSVREKAEQKLRSEVGRLRLLKQARPGLLIAVAGCVAQQEGTRLVKSLPAIDIVLGPDNIPELPDLLRNAEHGAPSQVRTVFDHEAPSFLSAAVTPGERRAPTAFVTTMKGCDERCTFCVVPFTRGSERYRPSAEILHECVQLVSAGVREITLLGQTVDSYRDPSGALELAPAAGEGVRRWGRRSMRPEDETEFPALLRAIASAAPDLKRLRYTSPHPRHLTPALVQAHAELPVLAKHVHMPVQSGSDRVLKRMGRRYTREEYIERTALLREAVPGLSLSTDMIVGFPGETDEDFEETLSLVREVGFLGVFAFKYSPRPFTAALNFGDDISEETKSERLSRLLALSEQLRSDFLQRLPGQIERVLVEGRSKTGTFTGRTERNEIVHFGAKGEPVGEVLEVKIERALKHSLVGRLLDERIAVDYDLALLEAAAEREAAERQVSEQEAAARALELGLPESPAPTRVASRRGLPIVQG